MIDLSVSVGSLTFKNPVLVASGTFGYGSEVNEMTDLDELGGIVTKSVTQDPRQGNPPPRIAELPAGMLNSIGLANVGVDAFIRDKLPFLNSLQTQLVVNIAASSSDEFARVLERLNSERGIAAYELNFSCPNVKEGGLAFSQDPSVTHQTVARLRKLTTRPLIVKLTPNVTRIGDIARAAAEAGADGLAVINTLVGMAIDIFTRRPRIRTITAGYSGPAIKPVALAKVYEVVQAVSIPVIGIGGIMTAADALEFIMAGATAVEIGTANFIDPSAGNKIILGLKDFCRREGVEAIRPLIGSLQV